MRKDIEIPEVKNVYVAALEVTDEQGDTTWWMHLINDTDGPLENILVQSKGYSDLETKGGKSTATLRKMVKVLPSPSSSPLAPLLPSLFAFFTAYWVSFFEGGQMKDRKYIFGPGTIDMAFSEPLPVLKSKGILIR